MTTGNIVSILCFGSYITAMTKLAHQNVVLASDNIWHLNIELFYLALVSLITNFADCWNSTEQINTMFSLTGAWEVIVSNLFPTKIINDDGIAANWT